MWRGIAMRSDKLPGSYKAGAETIRVVGDEALVTEGLQPRPAFLP